MRATARVLRCSAHSAEPALRRRMGPPVPAPDTTAPYRAPARGSAAAAHPTATSSAQGPFPRPKKCVVCQIKTCFAASPALMPQPPALGLDLTVNKLKAPTASSRQPLSLNDQQSFPGLFLAYSWPFPHVFPHRALTCTCESCRRQEAHNAGAARCLRYLPAQAAPRRPPKQNQRQNYKVTAQDSSSTIGLEINSKHCE
jgi:hypothetical protein